MAATNRPNNLWEPVDGTSGDYEARDDFSNRAKKKSWQVRADMYRGLLALAGAGIASVIGAVLFGRNR